jgi:hypothetical protein
MTRRECGKVTPTPMVKIDRFMHDLEVGLGVLANLKRA